MTKCTSSQGGYDGFKLQRFPVSQIPLMGLTSYNIMCHPYLSPLCPQLRLHPQLRSLCFLPHTAPPHAQALPRQTSLSISQEHLSLIWSSCAPGLCLRLLLPTSPILLPPSVASLLLTISFFQTVNFSKMKALLMASLRLNAQHSAWAYGRFRICIY